MLPLTRAWDDGDEARPAREAGSYFKHNSPLRQDLYLDAPRGERRLVRPPSSTSLAAKAAAAPVGQMVNAGSRAFSGGNG
ncbi:hypothetical protein [Phyllobacterium endophyticum]|uniref:Uncharacterized protein n=1 Tax=Phyllobacterium endophyticum TaxID=1149773 RepID=A0A2P7ARP0_9HYPH|nr:hypothetical protein [Phyllobacterium endophyticum]MBB3236502.1 hypothetical protein [Phyllobacterium endophyticum]PSH56840.1 hypothetical protein CU100_16080 [Phyllobacterium endophyticum]TYR39514.1 hypothetical protein FY050_20720 [Phyllobacterium endophyticum]